MGGKAAIETAENRAVGSVLAEASEPGKKERVQRIYLGPNLKGVLRGTVFLNGLPPALEEAIRKVPVVAELVVPVRNIRQVNRELANPDSALSRFYRAIKSNKEGE